MGVGHLGYKEEDKDSREVEVKIMERTGECLSTTVMSDK